MTAAIRVAVLDEQIPAQLRERPADASGLEVVWCGTDLDELVRFASTGSPSVIIADLERLGVDPAAAVERVLASSSAELFITVYRFAPRVLVEHLGGHRRRVLRAPVSIPMLKTQMMSAIVRGLLEQPAMGSAVAPAAPPPRWRSPAARSPSEPRESAPRYTDEQLGMLRERSSRLACECPNHVADLVSSLLAFERYSRACANRDDDDARMHRRLASATADARKVMEDVLAELLQFEGITV